MVTESEANYMKILEKLVLENKKSTVLSELDLFTNTILNLLNKLEDKNDAIKNILTLVNDALLGFPENDTVVSTEHQFLDSALKLSKVDASLPYEPFLKHLDNKDSIIKSLALYNLAILLVHTPKNSLPDKEVLIKVFDLLSSAEFIGNKKDTNLQFIGIQLLQELLVVKEYKAIYEKSNLVSNFASINELITLLAKHPNSFGLQLSYKVLLSVWILTFSASINKTLLHHYPDLAGNLLTIAKDSIKLKIVRVAVGSLKNIVSVTTSSSEQFKIIKLVLFHDGASTINTLKERKFASNGSDEELSNDLAYLSDVLQEYVVNKLTSLDEYLTELENPSLLSWASPTHKSADFWLENSGKFKENSYKLTKQMFSILESSELTTAKVILLNDLQFLIKNLGQDLINFINTEQDKKYKHLIMEFLDSNNGDNELKYQALRTIQLLVGHGV